MYLQSLKTRVDETFEDSIDISLKYSRNIILLHRVDPSLFTRIQTLARNISTKLVARDLGQTSMSEDWSVLAERGRSFYQPASGESAGTDPPSWAAPSDVALVDRDLSRKRTCSTLWHVGHRSVKSAVVVCRVPSAKGSL